MKIKDLLLLTRKFLGEPCPMALMASGMLDFVSLVPFSVAIPKAAAVLCPFPGSETSSVARKTLQIELTSSCKSSTQTSCSAAALL